MRHHGRADDPDREQHGLAPLELRLDHVQADGAERRVRVVELGEVAGADRGDEAGDHGLERAQAEALQAQDQEGRDPGQQRRGEERDPEQEVESERGAEELRQVGRHRDQLSLYPEPERGPAGEALPAHFRQVAPRRDPELGREQLDQHRHQARGDDHPGERVTELRAAGDVRREVAGVDVRDAGHERGAEEGEDPPGLLRVTAECLLRFRHRAGGDRL